LVLDGASSGAVTIKAASSTTAYPLTLPATQGSVNQTLINDGTGNLTWGANASGTTLYSTVPFKTSGGGSGFTYIQVLSLLGSSLATVQSFFPVGSTFTVNRFFGTSTRPVLTVTGAVTAGPSDNTFNIPMTGLSPYDIFTGDSIIVIRNNTFIEFDAPIVFQPTNNKIGIELDNTLSASSTTGLLQIAQQGALNGQALTWNSTSNTWTPTTIATGSIGNVNKSWAASSFVTATDVPVGGTLIRVSGNQTATFTAGTNFSFTSDGLVQYIVAASVFSGGATLIATLVGVSTAIPAASLIYLATTTFSNFTQLNVSTNLSSSLNNGVLTIAGVGGGADFTPWAAQTEQVGFAVGGGSSDQTPPHSISFTNATRTFTIAITSGQLSYDVWIKGTRYSIVLNQAVALPNTSGLYYITYQLVNNAPTLVQSTTPFDLENQAPVALIYWNADLGAQQYFADERHWVTMDWKS
ncbi:MAG: hypothetical protein ORN28_11345, partial [Rhodoferax sp.]|nr:hypothetical protein [Rhodoferax sp.]